MRSLRVRSESGLTLARCFGLRLPLGPQCRGGLWGVGLRPTPKRCTVEPTAVLVESCYMRYLRGSLTQRKNVSLVSSKHDKASDYQEAPQSPIYT